MEGTLAVGNPEEALEAGMGVERVGACEKRLLALVRQGDRQAAEELVDRTYAAVFAALLRLSRDRDLAADLTQETFRRAWENLARFDGRAKASTWLYRIAYNAFLNQARRPLRTLSLEAGGAEGLPDSAPAADEVMSASEASKRLRRAVLELPEELRFAVTARFWARLPVREIARSEGVSGVAIRKRLHRAFRVLEATLNRGQS